MSLPSGLPAKDRMAVLHDAAPVFVSLLDDADGVGVVRFDTDATAITPVAPAGPMIGGGGRLAASSAINGTSTNVLGMTAIGDGLEAAAAQLASVTGAYHSTATIVFTDGHETADKTVAMAASSVTSTVFAIGLGTADQLNPGALSDIADGTGGYLLLPATRASTTSCSCRSTSPRCWPVRPTRPSSSTRTASSRSVARWWCPSTSPPPTSAAMSSCWARRCPRCGSSSSPRTARPSFPAPGSRRPVARRTACSGSSRPTALAPGAGVGRWQAVLSVDDDGLKAWIARLREQLGDVDGERSFGRLLASIRTHGCRSPSACRPGAR